MTGSAGCSACCASAAAVAAKRATTAGITTPDAGDTNLIRWVNEETQVATGVVPTKRAIMITDVQYHGYGEDSWLTIVYVEVGA